MSTAVELPPPLPDSHATSSFERASKATSTPRGYSDSAISNCRPILMNDFETRRNATSSPLTNSNASGIDPDTTLSTHQYNRPRQVLQLPSFKTLGIATCLPDALLTPPDEATVDLKPVAPPILFSRSSSYPPSNMPDIPQDTIASTQYLSAAESSGSRPPDIATTEPLDATKEQEGLPLTPSTEGKDLTPIQGGWLANAVQAAAESIESTNNNVINVLCHSQPCPLSNGPNPVESTSAFDEMIAIIQNRIDYANRYIHITHAIPSKFTMSQIPVSPAATPIPNASAASTDYFSLPNNVFSNAVVAISHADASKASVPSSPHPVVPPSSITISLLERYIPPPSTEEYTNLFSPEGPSVLLDRLIELSPNNGSLVFIYPTSTGATTFAKTYLGPLLHPLLRTMCSIHHLSMDFGAGVGTIGAVDQMLSFESMQRKLTIMFRRLARGVSAVHRPPAKYTLVASNKQIVPLDRKTWTSWWTHQETPRIRAVVEKYLKRGSMMPMRQSGKDVSAATLVQEVLDGVREGRTYADYDEEREGVEVGVFVIRRTA